jgi:hypothetical protein
LQPSHFNKESGRLDFHVTIRPNEAGAYITRSAVASLADSAVDLPAAELER